MNANALIVSKAAKSNYMVPIGLCIRLRVTTRALRGFGEHNDPFTGFHLNIKDFTAVLTSQFPKSSIHRCGICRNRKHRCKRRTIVLRH
jgi:hypothetical protein